MLQIIADDFASQSGEALVLLVVQTLLLGGVLLGELGVDLAHLMDDSRLLDEWPSVDLLEPWVHFQLLEGRPFLRAGRNHAEEQILEFVA